jgi:hypothetical protein
MILILLPEYLRAFSEYRMLAFGAILVLMMVFKPGGIDHQCPQDLPVRKRGAPRPQRERQAKHNMEPILQVKALTMDFGGLRPWTAC